ncbi:MAG: phosphatidate cytidylyltransferase [Agarilytica sp.]
MLKQRVITAIILALAFLAALFLLPWNFFAAFIGAVLAVGAWEWAGLAGFKQPLARYGYVIVVAGLALLAGWVSDWAQNEQVFRSIMVVACVWWGVALLLIKSFPKSAVLWGARAVRLIMGVCVLLPAWLGSVYLRQQDAGAWLMLFVVFLVAAADIGAYFTGKAIGRTKLAYAVSPGKSWEGVGGGIVFAIVLALVFNFLLGADAILSLMLIAIPTSSISVVGDLLESMMKRYCGVKDSSQLLPGHGGVLDRIDGLVAAIPAFTLVYIFSHWHF